MSKKAEFTSEKYRWVELFVFALIGIQTQIVWIAFGPAMTLAASYYQVDVSLITVLAAIFMAVYIPMSFFASNLIEKKGLKNGVAIGVYLTALGGLIKAIAGPNYWIVLFGQLVAAIGQPFVLNCWSKLGTNWFTEEEKTIATGLGSIAPFFGVITAMLFPISSLGISATLWVYAILGIVFAIIYQFLAREKPANPPNVYAIKTKSFSQTEGIRDIFTKNKDFLLLFFIIFIGLGIFNAITSEIDLIFGDSRYPNVVSGDIGAAIIVGAVLGAIIISTISDKYRKRKIFLVLAYSLGIPFTIALIIFQDATFLFIAAFLYGFIMVSCMPVGLTYAAEITYPHTEESSAGILMVSGQISGIIFLFIPYEMFLWCTVGFCIIAFVLTLFLHDTKWHEAKRKQEFK